MSEIRTIVPPPLIRPNQPGNRVNPDKRDSGTRQEQRKPGKEQESDAETPRTHVDEYV
jgi:hypothetical protein